MYVSLYGGKPRWVIGDRGGKRCTDVSWLGSDVTRIGVYAFVSFECYRFNVLKRAEYTKEWKKVQSTGSHRNQVKKSS
ncbi:hypothetical protein L1987_76278 [Smallanthus sonchifolius]|uniref:Uncharacterized protein n=1 Tax=Smallanthus sonchifolius TaxID=185202 RepID=A0ACB9A7V2_9ASTR|nr:hypothetical protein L1987_76278 [Smallanthus sonchifolius]